MPDTTEHRTPGQLIRELLEQRGWTQRILALVLGVNDATVNLIVAGKRDLTAELALALSDVFGVPAERFMDLQKAYELSRARMLAPASDPARARRAALYGGLPIQEMIKRGWLDANDVRDLPKVEAALAKFFGASSPDQIEILPHAAKRANVAESVTFVQLAWLYRVRQMASDMLVGRYSQTAVRDAIGRLKLLLSAPEEARKAPRILAEAGVRFVIVEPLSGSKIDGVCLWLGDQAPVIGMSLRFDRIDNFWFILRHELEHVLRLHGRATPMVDAELEGDRAGVGPGIPEEERVANEAAADFCIPTKKMDQFVARKAPFFAERDMLGFARTLGVHPGLVAGQLQHRTGRHDRFRSHLVKVRTCVAPSAIVDGWGDVAPVGE